MELNNNTLIVRGVTRQITRGSVTKTISDTNWDAYITPVLYPLWSSDRDKLTIFEYSNGSSETWKCDKQKYVRNHTTGEYFWKDYQFTEPSIENVRTFVTAVREAFDAAQSVESTDVEDKLNRILELEKGISLTKVKIWRDFFLHSSDWTMLEDAPVTAEEKTQWKTWREKIRDLPSQFTSANINLIQSLKVPIDPKVYKDNYLPYNDGVGYLAKDDQYLEFPEGTENKYADMTYAMEAYIRVALTIYRPSKLFDVSSPSHITDPVERLLKSIEERQAAVQKLKDLNS